MIKDKILFQFHVTTKELNNSQKENFIKLCDTLDLKALLIQLPKGDIIKQPMFTRYLYADTLKQAIILIAETIKKFEQNGFTILRVKAEIPIENKDNIDIFFGFKPYFEWHCLVDHTEYEYKEIEQFAKSNNAHISKNSINNNIYQKYITIRKYENLDLFYAQTNHTKQQLKIKNIPIIKEKYEYCVFDSCLDLDKGWAF